MTGPCRQDRYKFCPSQERVIAETLQSISESEQGYLTRCEIEAKLPGLLHGAIAHALCDLVERGQVQVGSEYFQGHGYLTVWVSSERWPDIEQRAGQAQS